MKTELIKQFTKKMIRKVVLFAFLMVVMTAVGQAIAPLVSNELAMTQMQNSNEMYIFMNAYNKIRPVFGIVYSGIVVWFLYGIGRDIYKFTKTLSAENTEN